MTAHFLYGAAGILLFAIGLWSFLLHALLLRKLIAINIMGSGVFHVLIAVAYRGDDLPPDPVPHALVLTGIVVAVSATALALMMGARLDDAEDEDARATGSPTNSPTNPPTTPRAGATRSGTSPVSASAPASAPPHGAQP